jgi:hypothetical protein
MSNKLRLLIIFGAPVFVGVINLFHPVFFEKTGVYDAIAPVAGWWIALHVLNLIGFSLLGLAGYLLIKDVKGTAAEVGRVGLALFVPLYVGFDSLIGIGTGVLLQYGGALPVGALDALKATIDAYWNAGVSNILAVVDSVVWSISLTASAIAAAGPKRWLPLMVIGLLGGGVTGWGYSASTYGSLPWWIAAGVVFGLALAVARPSMVPALLIMAGLLFGTTHVVPFGPLGMACFTIAAALLELARGRAEAGEVAPLPA